MVCGKRCEVIKWRQVCNNGQYLRVSRVLTSDLIPERRM